ncbi:hypothetical protein HMPREF1143_0373 [Peptoanaerobacter stomatis]|uniref:Uncharacterized protein n=1 Tax=Peptoanaerobacter stomatis TaxID=796937 RepID=J5UCW6_9FIRM|nr:hypothetical protein [Peptoanaerobacter stomatis]EJU21574.1 hypothetical protein HMPREF1143_0373 [Peptoanaerobacter stomatis]NWO24765.1 hypothetical protein [Peptostreptococcaceae bacterium oral taxon 081]
MKFNPIIYIFLNYIFAMLALIYAILNKISLIEYISDTIFILICVNIIYTLVHFILSSLRIENDNINGDGNTFKLDIDASEDEIKDLLKENPESENIENTSNYIDNNSSSQEKENYEFDEIDFNRSNGQDF